MNIKGLMAALAALCLGLSAQAALERVEEAMELDIATVQLPAGGGGDIVVRECGGCDARIMKVSGSTTWHIGNSTAPVAFERLAAADREARTTGRGLYYIFYVPDSRLVTRVVLDAAL